jgi:hypothetical protein
LFTACVLVVIFAVPQSLLAQAHVVSPADLQRELVNSRQVREKNLASLQTLLASPAATAAMNSLHVRAEKANAAVASLSDAELARLAARVNRANADFAAGNITDHDLLIILVAILALILIIVAVRR